MNKKKYLTPFMKTDIFCDDIIMTSPAGQEVDGVLDFQDDWVEEVV